MALVLLIALIAPYASAQSDVFRFRVAVLDFSVDDLSGAVSDPIAVGRAIAAEFDEPLVQARRFIVLERRELVRVFDEQSLTEEGLTAEVVRQFGELFAADAIITGRVTVNPSGTIRVLAKIVDVKTGEVVVAHGLTAANIEARDQIASEFVNLALVQFPLRGRVVAIVEDGIYVNLGVAQGLTSRDATGAIYRERRIADLDVSERIGTFRVIEVLPEASRIEVTMLEDQAVAVGDTIEILPLDEATTPEPPPPTTGTLLVRGTPVGATIVVDGTVIGTLGAAGLLRSVRAGAIALEVRAEGHEPDRRQVDIVAGRITDVIVELAPSADDSPSPAPVVEAQSVPVAAGASHALYVRADGTVWSWGRNAHGQLGDGSTLDRATPVQVVGLTDVAAVASGLHHSLALRSDGTVWAWGANGAGQLGMASATLVTVPARIHALRDVVAVAAGLEHSLALLANGSVAAWGRNELGQLGDGTTTNRSQRHGAAWRRRSNEPHHAGKRGRTA